MTFLPIQLPPGIVHAPTPDAAPGRWYDGNQIRWQEGTLKPIGGWRKISSPALSGIARKLHLWRTNADLRLMLAGTEDKLQSLSDGTWTDVSPSGLTALFNGTTLGYGTLAYGSQAYGVARSGTSTLVAKRHAWSMDNWGEDVIALSSADGRLLYFDASSPTADAVPIGQYAISTISRTSNVTTVVTTAAHNLSTSDSVTISGVTGTGFDATAIATVTNPTTFTYANTGADGSGTGGTVLDNAVPTANRAVVVTPERHVMVLQVDGDPFSYGWSSREDYTDWDFASVTNTAGKLPVASETPLFAICKVREGMLMFSESHVYLVRYVGLPFIYGHDELAKTALLSSNACATMGGRAVWMTGDGFTQYDGGSVQPLECTFADRLFEDIDPEYGPRLTHAASNGIHKEVWWFYPSIGSTECDRYVIWNYAEDWWSWGSLARTAMFPAGAGPYPVLAGADRNIYEHEVGWLADGVSRVGSIYAESAVINAPGAEDTLHVSQILPSGGYGAENASFTLYSRMAPEGAERTFGPYTTRSDGYVDCRASGRDIRIKVASAEDDDFSIGRMRLKVAAGGKR